MADLKLTLTEAGELPDGRTGVVLTGSREAVKAVAHLLGEAVAVVPTEGPEFEAMVERAGAHLLYEPFNEAIRAALRAALTPGDQT